MFWQIENIASKGNGLFDAGEGRLISHAELLPAVARLQDALASKQKLLVVLFCDNSAASIAGYLAALRAGHAVMLVNAATDDSLKKRLFDKYTPEVVMSVGA